MPGTDYEHFKTSSHLDFWMHSFVYLYKPWYENNCFGSCVSFQLHCVRHGRVVSLVSLKLYDVLFIELLFCLDLHQGSGFPVSLVPTIKRR